MSIGEQHARLRAAFNARFGAPVVVVHADGRTQATRCQVVPLSDTAAAELLPEGALNAGGGLPHAFLFNGSADVREAVDTLRFAGYEWSILAAFPTVSGDCTLRRKAIAVRARPLEG